MIVTHSGRFHADEVFAVAMILMIEEHEVVRSREPDVIALGELVLDVGADYDPMMGRFDHHQNEFTEARDNGVPYATAGLIWRHYGERILIHFGAEAHQVPFALQWVDRKIVEDIDALDNGLYLDSERPSVSMLIGMMNGDTDDAEAQMVAFNEAVQLASGVFKRFIEAGIKQAQAAIDFERYADYQANGLVVLSEPVSYRDLIKQRSEIKRVVYPKGDEGFGVFCNGAENNLPQRFRGLREPELNAVSGLSDTVFCHKSGFMAICKSLESALFLAKSE